MDMMILLDGGYSYFAPDNSIRVSTKYINLKVDNSPVVPEMRKTPPRKGDLILYDGKETAIVRIDKEDETVHDSGLNEFYLWQFEGNYTSKGGRTKWLLD